jgi:hypothetical protein
MIASLAHRRLTAALVLLLLAPLPLAAQVTDTTWRSLFNGRDLTGWTPKIRGHALGENFGNTFRVVNGAITVSYDAYGPFNERFGHLFTAQPFADYHLIVEYRFTGAQQAGAPGWALRNSGAMLHAQPPSTMGRDQDFPISVELQLLGGLSDGRARTTANMCSPGTEVDVNGTPVRGHCLNSSSQTYDGDQWVTMEAIVRGGSITHIVNGDTVLTYTNARVGGGNVAGHDPAAKVDGTPLTSGYIALQSEGHPVEFRRVVIRALPR